MTLEQIVGTEAVKFIKERLRTNQVKPSTAKRNYAGQSGTTLLESGRLARSVKYRIEGDNIIIGSNLVYARIHHEGGIIQPVTAQYLAIPLNIKAKARRPRDFDNTFIAKGVIFQNNGDEDPTPLYALKKQVRIPARPYMFLNKSEQDRITDKVMTFLIKNSIRG